jgi:hypothetical protein
MNGPTLNPEYNDVLAKWTAMGEDSRPECEDCGCDLTGREVIEEDKVMWVCADCHAEWEEDDDEIVFSESAAQRAERQQMGFGS